MFDKKYWIWLSLAFETANSISDKLIYDFNGDPEAIYRATISELKYSIPESSPVLQKLLNKDTRATEKILDFCEANNVGILTRDSRRYPETLLRISGSPIVLYYKGSLPNFAEKLSVGVVGTRKVSDYGNRASYSISYDLAKSGVIVVSGMALGTDGSAHLGALDAMGSTVAVLGSGINVVYPKNNERIYYELLAHGTVITEYPPFSRPEGWHFPQRNRIISGLSYGVLVVEASEKSGALITADHAKKQGKLIYAVPGKVGEFNSLGTNELIRSGAKMVTCADDILSDFKALYDFTPIPSSCSQRPPRRFYQSPSQHIEESELRVAKPFVALTPQLFADDNSYMSMDVDPKIRAALKMYEDRERLEKELQLQYPKEKLTDDGYKATPYWELPKPPRSEKAKRPQHPKPQKNSSKIRSAIAKTKSKNRLSKLGEQKTEIKSKFSELTDQQRLIIEFIDKHGKATADELTSTGLAVHVLLSQLTMLEISGMVEQLPGGFYALK